MVEILTHVTRDDLVRLGCCGDGVREVADNLFPHETIVSVSDVLASDLGTNRELVLAALGVVGYGYGNVYGNCYVYGNFYGYGDGSGDGYGNGSGSGIGSGIGSGRYGSGSGG